MRLEQSRVDRKGNAGKWIIVIATAIAALVITAWAVSGIVQEHLEYSKGNDFYEALRTEAAGSETDEVSDGNGWESIPGEAQNGPDKAAEETEETEETEKKRQSEQSAQTIDFDKLRATCPDIVAWLWCPDTEIDYPIVQGEDNTYYLTHLADGEVNKNGCLFLDAENAPDFSDDNSIIYGHNMASGKMFAALKNYREQEYYDEHPYMYLQTPSAAYRMELFSAFTADPESDIYRISCGSGEEFAEWLRQIAALSDCTVDHMALNTSDRFVTFSTCDYSRKDARYVVAGRLYELKGD